MTLAETLIAHARQNRIEALTHRRNARSSDKKPPTSSANINGAPYGPHPAFVFASRRAASLALAG